MISGYRNLIVWQKSKALAVSVYKLSEHGTLAKDFGLKDQMCRAAVSVPSNIAEGEERGSDKDAARFLFIALGSLAELRTQLEIALEVGKVTPADYAPIEAACAEIARMLNGLVRAKQSAASSHDNHKS